MSALKLVVVAFLACLSAALAFNCDQPDRPNHGGFTPEKKYYRVGKKVNFYCKDGYYVDGVDSTVCVYDRKARRVGWKDPSPVCKPITCPDLDDPAYGFVELSGNKVGDSATYTCDYGFLLNGQEQRVCQKDGTWSGKAPTCDPITCDDLPDPQYGSVTLTGNRVGAYANYECDFGFQLSGDSQRVCLSSGAWSGEAPTCVPILCPDLEDPQYGSVSLSGNRVGDEAAYECDFGFELDGDSPRECLVSGNWGGDAPRCVPILCPVLDDPQYGAVETTDNRVGDVANYECNFGFSLEGDEQRECLISGDWSGEEPSCVPITCPDLPDPKYGSVSLTGNRVGDEADYECDFGFRLSGDRQRECLESGDWSGSAPTCVPITCPDLEDPLYGSVSLSGNRVGDIATYECDYGFRLEGDEERTCDVSGEWEGEAAICVRITCPDLDDPKYGSVKLTGNKVGDKATYRCRYGFKLVGEETRECLVTGEWSGEAPTCKRPGCPYLDDPAYGSVKITGTKPGSRAHYSCDKGFTLHGDAYRKCLYNGNWSGDAPTCRRLVDCGKPPAPKHGLVRYGSTTLGSRAYYVCSKGYNLKGSKTRVCQANGYWSGSTECVPRYYH